MLRYESVLTVQRIISPVLTPRHPYYTILVQRREHLGLYPEPSVFLVSYTGMPYINSNFYLRYYVDAMFIFVILSIVFNFSFDILSPYLLI